MAYARAAKRRRVRLHGNNDAGRNGSIRLHEHPEFAGVPGLRPEHVVSLAVVPAEANLTIDGHARVQSPFDARGRNGRSRL
jgi:hypothetical protein